MTSDTLIILLVVVGLGGAALWFLTRKEEEKPCGVPVSAYGVGTVVPCETLKEAVDFASKGAKGLADTVVHPFGLGMDQVDENTLCTDGSRIKDHGWRGCNNNGGKMDMEAYRAFQQSAAGRAVSTVSTKIGSTSASGFFGGK